MLSFRFSKLQLRLVDNSWQLYEISFFTSFYVEALQVYLEDW